MNKKIIFCIILFFLISSYFYASEKNAADKSYSLNNSEKINLFSISFTVGNNKNNNSKILLNDREIAHENYDDDSSIILGTILVIVIISIIACVLGGIAIITGIPLLAYGAYNYHYVQNDYYRNFIIGGAVSIGTGFLFCIPMIILGFISIFDNSRDSKKIKNKSFKFSYYY